MFKQAYGAAMSAGAAMLAGMVPNDPGFLLRNRQGPGVKSHPHRGPALANLSTWHPDWGMTPAEHAEAKAQRASGMRDFEPKAARRVRLGSLIR